MVGFDIRECELEDYREICKLNKDFGYAYKEEIVLKRVKNILTNKRDIILVAQLNDDVIGYLHGSSYEALYSDLLVNILGFVVDEKFRSLGVGNELIKELEKWAKDNSFSGVRLISSYDSLEAHKFYEKHGYINRKNQKNYIKVFNNKLQ
ncbi:GNAT family N-acetyltransferase [Clostridium carnis]